MKSYRVSDMTKGWFVGDFEPSVIRSKDVEVGLKTYCAGDYEAPHFHKEAVEITVIVQGEAVMFDQVFRAGDIIEVERGDVTDFTARTDVTTLVVKLPSVAGDKYLARNGI